MEKCHVRSSAALRISAPVVDERGGATTTHHLEKGGGVSAVAAASKESHLREAEVFEIRRTGRYTRALLSRLQC